MQVKSQELILIKKDIVPSSNRLINASKEFLLSYSSSINDVINEMLIYLKDNMAQKALLYTMDKNDVLDLFFSSSDYTPIKNIIFKSDYCALITYTVGKTVCNKIDEFITKGDSLWGYILDIAASYVADLAAEYLEDYFLKATTLDKNLSHALNYSPGYCGWDLKNQRHIFDILHPEQIGMSLNNKSYMMTPIKSISGIIVAGKSDIHFINHQNQQFCKSCKTKLCLKRLEKIKNEKLNRRN